MYHEAISSPDAAEWKLAMDEEISNLTDNDTFEFCSLPSNKSVRGGRWVYDKQVKDRDFSETFAPTAKLTSLKIT